MGSCVHSSYGNTTNKVGRYYKQNRQNRMTSARQTKYCHKVRGRDKTAANIELNRLERVQENTAAKTETPQLRLNRLAETIQRHTLWNKSQSVLSLLYCLYLQHTLFIVLVILQSHVSLIGCFFLALFYSLTVYM